MKEKGRSRALHRKPYGLCKRFLAAMIAAVMVTTNIGTDLTTAYAAESSDSVTFEMSGSGLRIQISPRKYPITDSNTHLKLQTKRIG